MELNPRENAAGRHWLIWAGLAGVALCLALAGLDHGLSASSYEKNLGQALGQLRSAQTSLSSEVTDQRQTLSSLQLSFHQRVKTNEAANDSERGEE
jgi:hypothetical protein